MTKPKRRSDSVLLREGCRSYLKALLAMRQFRLQVEEAIRDAVKKRIDDLAAAMKLDKATISEGLTAYADPPKLGLGWDGLTAEVGLRYPGRDAEAKWWIYFIFWVGDDEESCACASFEIKESGIALRKLASLGMETDDSTAWVAELITDADGFTGAIGRALDTWIEIWRKAGWIQQFLPPRKARENQAAI